MPLGDWPRYFVIFGMMRTGSNLLERTLGNIDGVLTFGEAFNPSFIGGPRKGRVLDWDKSQRDADPFGFLEAMIRRRPRKLIGFRHFDGHDAAIRAHVLADPQAARIVLRRDPLESYVSLRIAQATDQWMLNSPAKRLVAKIRFDPGAFDRFAREADAYYDSLHEGMKRAGQSALEVRYDELSEPASFARIADFLGLNGADIPATRLVRQNPEPLAQKVENYAEMCAHLGREIDAEMAASPLPETSLIVSEPLRLAHVAVSGLRDTGARAMIRRLAAGQGASTELCEPARLNDLHGETRFCLLPGIAERLHQLYLDQCVTGRLDLPHVRAELESQFGDTGDPDAYIASLTSATGRASHIARFSAFLDLIERALAGQGRHPLHLGWAPVSRDIARLGEDSVGRIVTASPHAASLSEQARCTPLAPDAFSLCLEMNREGLPAANEILPPDILARLDRIYAEDLTLYRP